MRMGTLYNAPVLGTINRTPNAGPQARLPAYAPSSLRLSAVACTTVPISHYTQERCKKGTNLYHDSVSTMQPSGLWYVCLAPQQLGSLRHNQGRFAVCY